MFSTSNVQTKDNAVILSYANVNRQLDPKDIVLVYAVKTLYYDMR